MDQYTEAYSGCLNWPTPVHHNPPITRRPPLVPARLPVLILSGSLDSLTPRLDGATLVARQMGPSARLVTLANLTHVTEQDGNSACAMSIYQRFVRDPGHLRQENTSCAGQVAPIHTVGSYPQRLRDAVPATSLPGNQASRRRSWRRHRRAGQRGRRASRWPLLSDDHDLGLRGGRVTFSGGTDLRITLHGVRWVSNATIDGRAVWDQSSGWVTARLTVHPVRRRAGWGRPGGGWRSGSKNRSRSCTGCRAACGSRPPARPPERPMDAGAAVWVVAGPPGSGKSTVARRLLAGLTLAPALLDKDTMYGVVRVAATLAAACLPPGEREGRWYDDHVKVHEYAGMTGTARGDPFARLPGAAVRPVHPADPRCPAVGRGLAELGGGIVRLVWVRSDAATLRHRLMARESARDSGKLAASTSSLDLRMRLERRARRAAHRDRQPADRGLRSGRPDQRAASQSLTRATSGGTCGLAARPSVLSSTMVAAVQAQLFAALAGAGRSSARP